MTDTRKPRTNERDLHAQRASAQAVAWIARQLRWEETLAALRSGRTPASPSRKAA
ncbi:MAG: hypothetical protein ACRDY4_09995 [Acidimicrobiia bacterium]